MVFIQYLLENYNNDVASVLLVFDLDAGTAQGGTESKGASGGSYETEMGTADAEHLAQRYTESSLRWFAERQKMEFVSAVGFIKEIFENIFQVTYR